MKGSFKSWKAVLAIAACLAISVLSLTPVALAQGGSLPEWAKRTATLPAWAPPNALEMLKTLPGAAEEGNVTDLGLEPESFLPTFGLEEEGFLPDLGLGEMGFLPDFGLGEMGFLLGLEEDGFLPDFGLGGGLWGLPGLWGE